MSRSEPVRMEARSGESTDPRATKPLRRESELRPKEAAFVCDTKLRVKSWSPLAERMFGWTARDTHGRLVSEVLCTQMVGADLGDAMSSLRKLGRLRATARPTCRDGTRIEVEVSWSVLCGSDGRRTGFLCLCRDTTSDEPKDERWGRMLLNQIPGVLWITDADLRATVSGGAGMAQLGFPAGEWVGKTIYEYFGTADPDFPAIAAHRSALAGKSVGFDYEWEGRSVHARVEPLRDADGTIVGVVGNAEDVTTVVREITERKQAEQELAEQKILLETIIQQAADGIVVCDGDGRLTIANPAARRLTGMDVDGARRSGNLAEAGDLWRLHVDGGATEVHRQDWPMAKALAGETTVGMEAQLTSPDGSSVVACLSSAPLKNAEGAIVGAVLILVDITAEKRAEQQIRALNQDLERRVRERTAELSAVVESSTEAIWSVDRQHRFLTFNAAVEQELTAVFGKAPRIGSVSNDGMSDRMRRHWRGLYDRALVGERFTFEQVYRIADVSRHFLVSMNPIVDQGQITGVTVFGKDISELKRVEEQARQREQELAHVLRVRTIGELAAGLAHEINQPLGAIANYAQGCRRRLETSQAEPKEILQAVESIAAEALRAGEVIRRLRSLIRRQEIRRERIDLNRAVLEAVKVASPQAERSGIAIRWNLAQDSPAVHADLVQVEQVVINLLVNALEAMSSCDEAAGEVVVETVRRHGEHVEVTVQDNGSGLPTLRADDIFKPFVGTKRDGLGMGLAISHSIIEAHGGKIWATSNRGPGTTFHFTLPIEE